MDSFAEFVHPGRAIRPSFVQFLKHFEIAERQLMRGLQFTVENADQPVIVTHEIVPRGGKLFIALM
jgi:hypothetical protein